MQLLVILVMKVTLTQLSYNLSLRLHSRNQAEITCSKLTIETLEQVYVNFEHILHLVLMCLLLTLSR